MPDTRIRINAKGIGGTMTVVSNENHTWYIDEPPTFGGANSAPSPIHMLMGAIAGCIIATGSRVANEMKLTLDSITIQVDGEICSDGFWGTAKPNARPGFSNIHVEIRGNQNWTKEQKQFWLDEVFQRCPVIDNLIIPTTLNLAWED